MMTDIGATIQRIYDTAEGDKVQAVQDYLSDKADRPVSRHYAETMVRLHVTSKRKFDDALKRAQDEYNAEPPLGHFYDDMGGGD